MAVDVSEGRGAEVVDAGFVGVPACDMGAVVWGIIKKSRTSNLRAQLDP
jgi:hypothetical protein